MVRATLSNGSTVGLAVAFDTPQDVLDKVKEQTSGALTGSALPDVWIDTNGGGQVRYADIVKLDPIDP